MLYTFMSSFIHLRLKFVSSVKSKPRSISANLTAELKILPKVVGCIPVEGFWFV